jgi:tetratricopeptide (TPR) repeat protein
MRLILRIAIGLAWSALISYSFARQASAPPPREQLRQYVMQLQADPADVALRTKIIRLALRLHPKPAIPNAVLEHEGAAAYAFKHAQSPADFTSAAAEYEKALLLAPWNARDYYNLGYCYEKATDQQKAIAEYRLYLLAAPHANDADEVTEKIVALKYQLSQKQAAETAQKQQEEEQQQAEEEQQREQAAVQSMWSGVWRITGGPYAAPDSYHFGHTWFEIRGDGVVVRSCIDRSYRDNPYGPLYREGTIITYEGYVSGRTISIRIDGNINQIYQLDSRGNIEFSMPGRSDGVMTVWSRVNDPAAISPKCPH